MKTINIMTIQVKPSLSEEIRKYLSESSPDIDFQFISATDTSTSDLGYPSIIFANVQDLDSKLKSVLKETLTLYPKTPLIIIINEFNSDISSTIDELSPFAVLKTPINPEILKTIVNSALDKITVQQSYEELTIKHSELESEFSSCKARFEAILDTTPNLIILVDENDIIINMNNSIADLFGLSSKEYLNRPLSDFKASIAGLFEIPDAFDDLMNRNPYEITERSKINVLEFVARSIKLKAPEEKYLCVTYAVIKDANGQIIGKQWNFLDLTDARKRADLLKAIVDASPIPYIISKVSDGEVIFANEPLAKLVGLPVDEVVGKKTPNFYYDPDDRKEAVRKITENGYVRDHEVRVRKIDGDPIWMIFNMVSADLSGEPVIIGGLYDIDQRKQAEEALKESENMLRQLTENINAVFWMAEPKELKPIYISPKIKDVLGIPLKVEEINETSLIKYIHPDDAGKFEETALQEINGEEVAEYRIVKPNGEVRWMREKAFPVRNTNDEIYRICGITEDVTESKLAHEALRESEERFRQLTDNINEVFWMTSVDKNEMIYVSQQFQNIWGSDPELLYKDSMFWQNQLHPDDRDRIIDALPKQVLGKYDEEYRIVRPDGAVRWVHDTAFPIKDDEGNPVRICGVVEDITDRKNNEIVLAARLRYEKGIAGCSKALLKYGNENQAIENSLRHLLTAADADRVYFFENFEDESFGLCAKQIAEVCAEGVKPEIDNPLLQNAPYDYGFERGRKLLENGEHFAITRSSMTETELALVDPQGTLSMILLPINVSSKWHGFIGFDDVKKERIWDFEEIRLLRTAAEMIGGYLTRIRTLDALSMSEGRFRGLVENANDIIYSMDSNGKLTYVSPQFEKSTGYKTADVIGNTIDEFIHKDDLPDHFEWITTGIRELERRVGYEFRLFDKDGNTRWFSTNSSVIKNSDNEILEIVGVAHDITEMKLVLKELEETNKNLRQTQAQLVQSEKMASLGLLVAGIAHEINTPIGAINSMHQTLVNAMEKMHNIASKEFGDLFLKNPDFIRTSDIIREANRVIKTGTSRVTEIVRRLRSFARLDEAELKNCNIHDGIDDTLLLIHHEIKHGIDIVKKYGDIPSIACYLGRLNQVFMNILINAKQSMSGKGTITIETFRKNNSVCIRFSDTGVGIPKDKIDKIFDPGFTTKGVGIGTGLGLSICYQIIQDHHGQISVESEVGKGTSFTIEIPMNLDETVGISRQ